LHESKRQQQRCDIRSQDPERQAWECNELLLLSDMRKNGIDKIEHLPDVQYTGEEGEGMSDNVHAPSHYTDNSSVECIDMIRLVLGNNGFRAFCCGCCMKYLWRWKFKNGAEDVEKASVYFGWLQDMQDEEYFEEWDSKINTLARMIADAEAIIAIRNEGIGYQE